MMHRYIVISIHWKVKKKLSLLPTIFISRWNIFTNNFIVFIHVHIFSTWGKMPIDIEKGYKYKHWQSFYVGGAILCQILCKQYMCKLAKYWIYTKIKIKVLCNKKSILWLFWQIKSWRIHSLCNKQLFSN